MSKIVPFTVLQACYQGSEGHFPYSATSLMYRLTMYCWIVGFDPIDNLLPGSYLLTGTRARMRPDDRAHLIEGLRALVGVGEELDR